MKLEQTAIHEAGHVVVAHVLGLATKEVALTHDEVTTTGAYGKAIGPHPVYDYHHGSIRERREAVREECVACCAGLAAEHVFFDVPLATENEHAKGDFQNIIDLERSGELRIPGKKSGFVGDDITWAFIEKSLRKAKLLVKRNRETIQLLADRLVSKTRMSEEEVTEFLEGARTVS